MGTPQGGIISPTLANITLNGLEARAQAVPQKRIGVPRFGPSEGESGSVCRRFCRDRDSKELLETLVKPWIAGFLRERGLTLSEEKTKIVHIDEGFDFLGGISASTAERC
jgi:RNA-directed DNA polymerase